MGDRPQQPAHEPEDQQSRRADVARLAREHADATWGDEASNSTPRLPGVLSGDLGPKGRVSARMRDLHRSERRRYGDVPRGTFGPGGVRYVLAPLLAFAALVLAVVILVGWLLS